MFDDKKQQQHKDKSQQHKNKNRRENKKQQEFFLTTSEAKQKFSKTNLRRVGIDGIRQEKANKQLKKLQQERRRLEWGPWIQEKTEKFLHEIGKETKWLVTAMQHFTYDPQSILVIYFKSNNCSLCQKFSFLWRYWKLHWFKWIQLQRQQKKKTLFTPIIRFYELEIEKSPHWIQALNIHTVPLVVITPNLPWLWTEKNNKESWCNPINDGSDDSSSSSDGGSGSSGSSSFSRKNFVLFKPFERNWKSKENFYQEILQIALKFYISIKTKQEKRAEDFETKWTIPHVFAAKYSTSGYPLTNRKHNQKKKENSLGFPISMSDLCAKWWANKFLGKSTPKTSSKFFKQEENQIKYVDLYPKILRTDWKLYNELHRLD